MKAFIDPHRDVYGVEPICKVLPGSIEVLATCGPSGRFPPEVGPLPSRCDERLCGEIRRVWEENLQVYGADKVWQPLRREGLAVARCTVERLMRRLGLQGVRRGKSVNTTVGDRNPPCPQDRVNRQFAADRPNALWVADFTDVSTGRGFVSVGSVGDSYDNALAETINGLYKAEVIHRRFWKNLTAVEWATLAWVDWFNHRRLLESIGYIPPAEAEIAYYRSLTESAMAA